MNEKQVKNAKLTIKMATGLAALFALIGAIITLATMKKASEAFYVGNDMARFGAFGVFILSALFMGGELIMRSKEKLFGIVMGIASALGFVGCFLASLSALISASKTATSEAGVLGAMTTGCIFILISAVVAIACVVIMIVQPMMANKAPYGYGQMPMQQYPGQQYPNQQYPNQQYPNQQIPNQQYPNQQMPNQQYPNQQNNNFTQQ